MKVITWNCNLNLVKKFDHIRKESPDIAIIQECEKLDENYFPIMRILRRKGNSYKKIVEVVTKSTRKKFPQSWVFNILKRESTIPPNDNIIRDNICNVEFQPSIFYI